ncbi:hypothetical protein R1flu_003150 [Riccia fluitans]|uniref:Uncharacterized protein n=1 Tax=Riccia fluitans TaxID=41844 RepID=A0ABD1Y8C3_9MARC
MEYLGDESSKQRVRKTKRRDLEPSSRKLEMEMVTEDQVQQVEGAIPESPLRKEAQVAIQELAPNMTPMDQGMLLPTYGDSSKWKWCK